MNDKIIDEVNLIISRQTSQKISKPKILITAGPTYEDIDDVRFIGNRSSGKMGISLATKAFLDNHQIVLITGPVAIELPSTIEGCRVKVRSALEMFTAVKTAIDWADIIIMTAAVADYRPENRIDGKIHKSDGGMSLKLIRNPDILTEIKSLTTDKIVVGFSLDSDINIEIARQKLIDKNITFIIANSTSTFNSQAIKATIIEKQGELEHFEGSKDELAEIILNKCKDYSISKYHS